MLGKFGFLVVAIIAIILVMRATSASLKTTSATAPTINSDYLNVSSLVVQVENGTYDLTIHWDVLKNFPIETFLLAELIVQSDTSERPIKGYSALLCQSPDKYQESLPPYIRLMTANGTKCPIQGPYTYTKAGQYRFENLMKPEEFAVSPRYKVNTTIGFGTTRILKYVAMAIYA